MQLKKKSSTTLSAGGNVLDIFVQLEQMDYMSLCKAILSIRQALQTADDKGTSVTEAIEIDSLDKSKDEDDNQTDARIEFTKWTVPSKDD